MPSCVATSVLLVKKLVARLLLRFQFALKMLVNLWYPTVYPACREFDSEAVLPPNSGKRFTLSVAVWLQLELAWTLCRSPWFCCARLPPPPPPPPPPRPKPPKGVAFAPRQR